MKTPIEKASAVRWGVSFRPRMRRACSLIFPLKSILLFLISSKMIVTSRLDFSDTAARVSSREAPFFVNQGADSPRRDGAALNQAIQYFNFFPRNRKKKLVVAPPV